MKLGIVGGALQGMESIYLAGKAGYETVVIDRRADAPALSLADEVVILDVVKQGSEARKILSDCDAVLPANENIDTLRAVDSLLRGTGVPLLFDLNAYNISSSKVLSNELFDKLSIPAPLPWPACGYPAVVKPSGASGSAGVVQANNDAEMRGAVEKITQMSDVPVVQEFVNGPNISVEVIGNGDRSIPLVLTEVVLDDVYDCKMVLCPTCEPRPISEEFRECGRKLADALSLRGIMDVEAIVHNDIAKVLEIDARIPSQTPAAVLNATGINILQVLVDALVDGKLEEPVARSGAAIYEHIAVKGDLMRSCGEGVFANVRTPKVIPGLFGSDEMLTDYLPGKTEWYATVICSAPTPEAAWEKRQNCLRQIIENNGISQYVDPEPEMRK